MIRAHFGITKNPFEHDGPPKLLEHQQQVMDILLVHAQQGGLCLILGEAGTGKTVIKNAILALDPKRHVIPVINRTLNSWHTTLRLLCEACQVGFEGGNHKCERLLLAQAYKLHREGKLLMPVIDDAHLMPADCLRRLRLLLEDFPRTHNLVLIGQPPLLQTLSLSVNEEIKSRVTYSEVLPRLAPEAIRAFLLDALDQAGLGHNTINADALALIVRSAEGLLRRSKNLCLGSLVQAVHDKSRCVELRHVNNVLRQPHWRKDCDRQSA